MGNIAAFDQLPSPLRSLNEDNMVVLLQYLDVADYVHLTATCRKFLRETLGPNNYFWAQLLNRSWQPEAVTGGYGSLPTLSPTPTPRRSTPMKVNTPTAAPQRLINHVLQTTRNGRKFEIDGKPLDLTIPLDTLNKKLVGHFDFRNEIKMYFFRAKWAPALRNQFTGHVIGTNARADVRIEETVKPQDYVSKLTQIQLNELVRDVTFVVDLGVDATSLEKLKHMELPSVFKLRRVVYERRDERAVNYRVFSRTRMPPPLPLQPMQPPLPILQSAGGPMPVQFPGGPVAPGMPPVPPQQQQQRNTAFDQLPSPLRSLNEDNMVVLLQYLDVADYVHLTATCRKFLHETLGPNNYFWAQLLNRSCQPVSILSPPPPQLQYDAPRPIPVFERYFPSPQKPSLANTPTVAPQRLINHVLQTTRNGRKFEIDGKPLDLTIPLDTLNKKLVGHFDFCNEIKMYFFKAKWAPALETKLLSYVVGTNARANVRIEESIKPQDYFIKSTQIHYGEPTQLLPKGFVTDVTFVVDLGVDPTSLEKLRQKQLGSTFKLRRVVYVKSNVPARDYSMMSRSRMMPPPPIHKMQQLQPIPQPLGGSILSQYDDGPGIFEVPLDAPLMPTNPQLQHYTPLPPQPQPLQPQPQIGFRPVQLPPMAPAKGLPPSQRQQQQQK